MAITIVGGGAIGLFVAGRLALSEQRVALVARPDIVEALRRTSLRLLYRKTVEEVPAPPVAAEPSLLPAAFRRPDLAILCVKGYDTASALNTLKQLQPYQILTLQNGLGNEEMLADAFGTDRILSGVITSSVERENLAIIRVTKMGGIGMAGLANPPRMRVWGAVLGRADFKVREYANYRALKWSKVLLNMLGNAIPAILDMPVGAAYADRELVALERQAFLEALRVMDQLQLQPVNLPAYPVAVLAQAMQHLPEQVLFPLLRRLVAGGRGGKMPSLHMDLQRRRPVSEGTYLYGAIAQTAQEHDVPAPVNMALAQTLEGIASGLLDWGHFRQQPENLLTVVQA